TRWTTSSSGPPMSRSTTHRWLSTTAPPTPCSRPTSKGWQAPMICDRRSSTTGRCFRSCWKPEATAARRHTMHPRQDDRSTAALAPQQPSDPTPPARAAAADVQRRDPTDDELRREDLPTDGGSRDTTVVGDRRPDQERATTPVDAPAAQAARDGTAGTASPTGP